MSKEARNHSENNDSISIGSWKRKSVYSSHNPDLASSLASSEKPSTSAAATAFADQQQQQRKSYQADGDLDDIQDQSMCLDFDDIIERVGSNVKYQKRLLLLAISVISAVQPILAFNAIFMLFTPEHWCAGADRESWDDVEEYKLVNIPMKNGTDGLWKYESCTMYGPHRSEIKCPLGWEYDKSNYEKTVTSENDWVCDKANIPTYALLAGTVGNAVGLLAFGLLSDKWGRKPTLFLAIFINVVFRLLSIFLTGNWLVFCVAQFFAGLSHTAIYILPSLISAELCSKDDRAEVYATTWTICLIGLAVLPGLSWLCGDWFRIGVYTTAIGALMLIYFPFLPESPRWLLQKGRLEEASKILKKIQNYNRKQAEEEAKKKNGKKIFVADDKVDDIKALLQQILDKQNVPEKESDSSGDADIDKPNKKQKSKTAVLLTKKNLAKNTLLLTVCWSMNTLIYSTMTFNAMHMSGSHFKNFFLLAIIEVPSGFFGGYSADTIGRRWTQMMAFALCALGCFSTSIVVHRQELEVLLAIVSKLVITVSFLVVYLQATELFPTELRSTGSGIASTIGNFVGIAAPVIAKLSSQNAAYPWLVMTGLSIIGGVASLFLPETLNLGLPETIEDANNIGKQDKFCGLPASANKKRGQQNKTIS